MRRLIGGALTLVGAGLLLSGIALTVAPVCTEIPGGISCLELGPALLTWGISLLAVGLPLLLVRRPRDDPFGRLGEPSFATVSRTLRAVRWALISTLLGLVIRLGYLEWLVAPTPPFDSAWLIEGGFFETVFVGVTLAPLVGAAILWRSSLLVERSNPRRIAGGAPPERDPLRGFRIAVVFGLASFLVGSSDLLLFLVLPVVVSPWTFFVVFHYEALILGLPAAILAAVGAAVAGSVLRRQMHGRADLQERRRLFQGTVVVVAGEIVGGLLGAVWTFVRFPSGWDPVSFAATFAVGAVGPAVIGAGLVLLERALRRIRDLQRAAEAGLDPGRPATLLPAPPPPPTAYVLP
ncbi:MAG: hypothetical protein KGJ23_09955 [Euryarchaeota archaeon]|nr:hypothetical protein [Euryarchaeota archaeon]MDE1836927.1 hypothetical protein [Euryarchaeota archaeon]MDE1881521.1 hypothetical protein [Euryarchaeota archaeon]